jgi:hypothetical protein
MSKCYKCGQVWTNENRVETPLLCPECSLDARNGSALGERYRRTAARENAALLSATDTRYKIWLEGRISAFLEAAEQADGKAPNSVVNQNLQAKD